MLRSRVMPTWNAIAAFSEEHVAKLVYRVLLLYLAVIVLHAIGSCKSERRELQGSADLQPLILGLNFWHPSFLTTIIVDHYPLLEFPWTLHEKNVYHDNYNQCV